MLLTRYLRISTLALGAVLLIFAAIPAMGEPSVPEIYLEIGDTTAETGASDAWVSVYLANYTDTLAGFSLHLRADQPDIIQFQTDIMDPLTPGGVDTAGTAISGWQTITTHSYNASLSDIKVFALADDIPPPIQPGLPPQAEPVLLMRLKIRTTDSLPSGEAVSVNLRILEELGSTGFSDPSGQLIGTEDHYNICDTTYWKCIEWVDDLCLGWEPSIPELADSVRVDTFYTYWCCDNWVGDSCWSWIVCEPPGERVTIDSLRWVSLDTTKCFYYDGVFTVIPYFCCKFPGEINNDGAVNVGDAVSLINCVFRGGPMPPCPQAADINHDCQVNVADVVAMIRPLFNIWPFEPLECAPDTCQYIDY